MISDQRTTQPHHRTELPYVRLRSSSESTPRFFKIERHRELARTSANGRNSIRRGQLKSEMGRIGPTGNVTSDFIKAGTHYTRRLAHKRGPPMMERPSPPHTSHSERRKHCVNLLRQTQCFLNPHTNRARFHCHDSGILLTGQLKKRKESDAYGESDRSLDYHGIVFTFFSECEPAPKSAGLHSRPKIEGVDPLEIGIMMNVGLT